MKIRLVYEHDETREIIVAMKCIPRIGEKVEMEDGEYGKVTYVIFTPWDPMQQAVVTIKRSKQ